MKDPYSLYHLSSSFLVLFYVGEGSSTTVFNPALCKVYPPGPLVNDPNTLYSRVKTLTKQMWDRFRVVSSSLERGRRNDIRIDRFDDDLTTLDSTFREQIQEMKKLITGLNEQGDMRDQPNDPTTEHHCLVHRRDDSYVMVRDNAVRADAASDRGGGSADTTAVVKDVGEDKEDEGDDAASAKDLQPSESRGPPRDP
ncbi:hypothetical protein Tco_0407232 [Tanacetum coccineum]